MRTLAGHVVTKGMMVLAAIMLSPAWCPALTTLFQDQFTGQATTGTPTNWTYGTTSSAQTKPSEDTFAVVNNGTSEVLRSVDAAPVQTLTAFHSTNGADLYTTGDTIVQLNMDMTINSSYYGANYRMGIYSTNSTSTSVYTGAYLLRLYPSRTTSNVVLLTFNTAASVVDNEPATAFTVDPALIQGSHTFSIQVDFSQSDTQPKVRAYSNGTLLGEITAGASGGFDRVASQAGGVRAMAQANTVPQGSYFEIDNVKLVSFTPASVLLGSLQSNEVNHGVFGHNMEAADGAGIFGTTTSLSSIQTGGGFWNPTAGTPDAAVLQKCQDVGMSALRYPGGCLAHNYNWKQTIGPVSQRAHPGDWKFGLDEFLKLCEQIGAEPVITVSDYVLPADEMPSHAAELVEYLNAPAIPANYWAMKRAEYGHPAPYGVKWFELGNESMHGNHDVQPYRIYTAEEYSDYAVKTAWAMRSVDPSIYIGMLTWPGGGQDVTNQWNVTVMTLAGKAADFAIIHMYAPQFWGSTLSADGENDLMQGCMAVGEQIEKRLQSYRTMIQQACGRNLPLAITEYNASFIQDQPKPYRFSYGAALECADLLRIFLKNSNGVVFSSYWQFLNGYWGMLGYQNGVFTEKPAYPLYRLWGQHFGDETVPVEVSSPLSDYAGTARVDKASGSVYQAPQLLTTTPLSSSLILSTLHGTGVNGYMADSTTLDIDLTNYTGNSWPKIAGFVKPSAANGQPCDYELTYEGRYLPSSSTAIPFALLLQDSRGWNQSQSSQTSVTLGDIVDSDWKSFWGKLNALNDAPGISILTRMEANSEVLSGKLEIRNPVLKTYLKEVHPAYAQLTAAASKSANGNTLYVIIFNKGDLHIPASINFRSGFNFAATSAKRWEVNGPGLGSTSGVSEVATAVPIALSGGGIKYVFPAHSMTAFELYAAQ